MSAIKNLKEKLMRLNHQPSQNKVMVGFDGYVDIIQKVVLNSTNASQTFYHSLNQLGKQISAAAGKSAQIELRSITTKIGGNAPIMANALGALGISNYCVGMMGDPEIHTVFQSMHKLCTLLSIGPPAMSNALEFDDGKLILSEVSAFDHLDLSHINALKGPHYLDTALEESKLIAMVDWSNLPKCSLLWSELLDEIKHRQINNKIFFFDLCDPSKKTPSEILEVLSVISRFKTNGKTVLGLNENEALKVYTAIQSQDSVPIKYDLKDIAHTIFKAMDIDILLVHPVDRSITVTTNGIIELKGKVVSEPKILTGGGDNLNAGFCAGLLNEYSVEECMMLGMATSGAYVKNGYSACSKEIINYLDTYG